MLRPNFKDEQIAFEYAMYMMVGSFFKKATAANKEQETSYRIIYNEERVDDQVRMENACERFVREKLSHMPRGFWQEEMTVSFIPMSNTKVKEIRFSGKKYVLSIAGACQKKQFTFYEPALYKKRA